MKCYPRIGTRVIVTDGEWAGRQARTEKTVEGHGRIELTLLGGAFKLGVSVRLEHVERDPNRRVHKLPPRKLGEGDRLFSLRGLVWPMGHYMRIRRVMGDTFYVESDYGQHYTLQPTEGFEKRWALCDGCPIERPVPQSGGDT